jgi:hypothetical protein
MHRYGYKGARMPPAVAFATWTTYRLGISIVAVMGSEQRYRCRQINGGQKPGYIAGQNAFAALDTKTKKKKKGKDDKGKKDKGKSGSATNTTSGGVGLTSTTLPTISDANFEDLDWAEEDEDDGFAMAPMADWVQVRKAFLLAACVSTTSPRVLYMCV